MGRSARALHPFRRLKTAAWAFVLALGAGSVFAADYIPAGSPTPQNIRWVNATATGADTSAFARMGGQSFHVPVPVSSSTLGKLAGAAVRRGLPIAGWGLVLKDLVNGAGWVIDELGQQVMTEPSGDAEPLPNTAFCITPVGGAQAGSMRCASTTGQLSAIAAIYYPPHTTGGCTVGGMSSYPTEGAFYLCKNPAGEDYGRVYEIVTAMPADGWQQWHNANPGEQPVAVSDQQLGDLVKASPQVVNAVLIDPVTGAPIRTQELVNAMNALAAAVSAANGVPAPPPLAADTTFGEDGTPSQSDTQPVELPDFCAWATTVCGFIEWVKAPEEETPPPPDPWIEEPQVPEQEWSSGLGGGSCPGPISFNVSIASTTQNIDLPYTPLCEAATWIRGIAIPLCGLLAVFIVGGYRRSANA